MILLATNTRGVTRAEGSDRRGWRTGRALTELRVTCLEADPQRPGRVWAGTQGRGVFRSDDGGGSWIPAGLDGVTIKSLAVYVHSLGGGGS